MNKSKEDRIRKILTEISKPSGAWNNEPIKFRDNVINDVARKAIEGLKILDEIDHMSHYIIIYKEGRRESLDECIDTFIIADSRQKVIDYAKLNEMDTEFHEIAEIGPIPTVITDEYFKREVSK